MKDSNISAPEKILSIVLGYWQARALAMATELDLADLLTEGPIHVDELANRTKSNASALFRLLRALESIGFFTEIAPRVFANTSTSEYLRENVPGSQRPFILQSLVKGNGPFEGWNELEYVLKTGEPSLDKIYGCNFWEFLRRNPRASAVNNGTMRAASIAMTPTVTAAYQWSQFPVIADIGGGIGTQLVSILDVATSSKGILFDQPHNEAETIPHPRMEVVSGDFFNSVPTGADLYLLRWILHDWSDTKAEAILRSVRKAMKPTARLILVEFLIQEGAAFDFGKWADLQMLVLVEGRERTEAEFRALLATAGFDLQEVIPTASPLNLLVAKPV